MSLAIPLNSPVLLHLGQAADWVCWAADLLPFRGGLDSKVSTLYGAFQGLGRKGNKVLGAVHGAALGWVITFAAERLRDWDPPASHPAHRLVRDFKHAARLIVPQVGPAGIEGLVGGVFTFFEGLLFRSKGLVGSLKSAVADFFVWGGVQLAVQNTIDARQFADTRPFEGPMPSGLARWLAQPAADRAPFAPIRGERVNDPRLVEDDRVARAALPNHSREKLENVEETLRARIDEACRKYRLIRPRNTHRIYLATEHAEPRMPPHQRAIHSIDLEGGSVLRLKDTDAERCSFEELLEEVARMYVQADHTHCRLKAEGNVVRVTRGLLTVSNRPEKSDEERQREADGHVMQKAAVGFMAHVLGGIRLLPFRSPRKLQALFRALGDEQKLQLVQAVDSALRFGHTGALMAFLQSEGVAGLPETKRVLESLPVARLALP